MKSLNTRTKTACLQLRRADATRQALVTIVELCIYEQVDALIIAGDLYDVDQTSMKNGACSMSR